MLTPLPVCQVRFLDIDELCPRTMEIEPAAQLTHYLVRLLYPFPQQLRVRRITHLALITGRVRVHRIKILHVRLPHLGEQILLLLDFQFLRHFHCYRIQKFVVRQGTCRIYRDVAEDLEVDVPVQLLKQFGKTQLSVHFQEHQGDLSLRREVGLSSKLRPQAPACQAKALCHLVQRKEFLYPAEFGILEGLSIAVTLPISLYFLISVYSSIPVITGIP